MDNKPVPPAEPAGAQPEKPRLPTVIWVALGAVVLAIAGAGAAYYWTHRPSASVEAPPPVVITDGEEVLLMGNVSPRDAVAIPAPLEGVLQSMEVPLGSEVLMGQIVARMTNQKLSEASESAEEGLNAANDYVTNLEALLTAAKLEATRASAESAAAESEADRAKTAAERQQLLFKEGVTPRKTYEQAQKESAERLAEAALLRESARGAEERAKTLGGDLDAAKKAVEDRTKALEEAAENLRTGEVLSPIDGVLVAAKVGEGEAVPADTLDLFHVAPNATKLAVALEPDPALTARFQAAWTKATAENPGADQTGIAAEVALASAPDLILPGRLMRVEAPLVPAAVNPPADENTKPAEKGAKSGAGVPKAATPPAPKPAPKPEETVIRWEVQFDVTEQLWKPGETAAVRLRLPAIAKAANSPSNTQANTVSSPTATPAAK